MARLWSSLFLNKLIGSFDPFVLVNPIQITICLWLCNELPEAPEFLQ